MNVLTENEFALHADDEALLQSAVFAVGATLDCDLTFPFTSTSNLLQHVQSSSKQRKTKICLYTAHYPVLSYIELYSLLNETP